MSSFATLFEVLAARRSSANAMTFISGENSERTVRHADLYDRALALLNAFQAVGAQPGSELMIVVDANEPFIDAFWACQLGRILAVPLAIGNTDEHRRKFFRVLSRLGDAHLCTERKTWERLAAFAESHGHDDALTRLKLRTVFIDQLTELDRLGRASVPGPDDVALVQFSSGSTNEPKGVVLTHQNLLANIDAIIAGTHAGPSDTSLSWMPLTHDMGLIGFHLTPLVADIAHCLLPTALFVRRPGLWLIKATQKHSTVLSSPNFGYRHLLRNFDPATAPGLDLSSVRLIFNGAEPISAELAKEFVRACAPARLSPRVMFPVYGLAEASLAVSFPESGSGLSTIPVSRLALAPGDRVDRAVEGDPDALELVRVGRPVAGCEVRIGDTQGMARPDGSVGRVLIRGDNVTRGYYRDEAATRAAIDVEGWLDTGDLGFFLDGELTITGRIKEIIFVSGQNFYPQDLELILERETAVEAGRAAVVGVRAADAATDDLVVFMVSRGDARELAPLARDVRRAINEHTGAAVAAVVPISQLPKTTSGKVQRFALARRYLDHEFDSTCAELQAAELPRMSTASGESELERKLLAICQPFLPGKMLGPEDNIFELGTSSLALAQIYERIDAEYPGTLEVTDFFDYPTLRTLAAYLSGRLAPAHA